MAPERWQQIKALFEEARDLPQGERVAFLDEQCGGDEELRQEVQALLDTDTSEAGFLEAPASRLLAPVAGRKIGNYRVLDEIGRGGMGVVYRAVAVDDQYEQPIALKVSNLYLDRFESRLETEGAAYRKLKHPHIAGFIGGGTSQDERPYLVLEEVLGVPIDAYCRDQKLNLRERLELFLKVCDAVQYAHSEMVVHCDLKPSNILVTENGDPKLLDFGVAKLLSPPDGPEQTVTVQGERAMTFAYASPEQVQGASMGATSDVYSLGVLLYELLTGQRPYEVPPKNLAQAQRIIADTAAPKPSAALSSTSPVPSRNLKGDLDTIVEKALRKEPGKRFRDVGELARDIQRYLDGEPITARPATLAYRAGKFVRRYKWPVALVASLFLTMAVFSVVLWKQQQETAQERDRAETIADFLNTLFEKANPRVSPGEALTVRQVLDEGVERIDREFLNQLPVRAKLLDTMAQSYQDLGYYEQAQPLFGQLTILHREISGPASNNLAESKNKLGLNLYHLGRNEEAQVMLEEALAIWEKAEGSDGLGAARTYTQLGMVARANGDHKIAEGLHRKALDIRRRILGEQDPLVSETLYNLGVALRSQQLYEEAISVIRESLVIDREISGTRHQDWILGASELGVLLRKTQRWDEAEQYFTWALEAAREVYPDGHVYTATVLNNFALLKNSQGQVQAAEAFYREALAIHERTLGRDHPHTLVTLENLAAILRDQRRFEEAAEIFGEILGVIEQGDNEKVTVRVRAKYARVMWDLGQKERAILMYERVVARRTALFDDTAPVIATGLAELAFYRETAGRLEEAEALCEEALVRDRRTFGEEHLRVVRDLKCLASVKARQGDYLPCEEHIREVRTLLPKMLPTEHPTHAEASSLLGICLIGQGRAQEGETLLQEAIPILEAKLGNEHMTTQRALEALSQH